MSAEGLSRRDMMLGSVVLGLGGGVAAVPAADAGMARSGLPDLADPAVSLRQMVI